MSSVVGRIYFFIVARSCCGRSCNALSKSSRPRATGAFEQGWAGHNTWRAGDAGRVLRSDLRLRLDGDDRATEGDARIEGIGTEREVEERPVWLAAVRGGKNLRNCRNRSHHFVGAAMPVIKPSTDI